jgi:hypothetical protein
LNPATRRGRSWAKESYRCALVARSRGLVTEAERFSAALYL